MAGSGWSFLESLQCFCEWPPFTPSPPSVDIWKALWVLKTDEFQDKYTKCSLFKILLKTSLLSLTVTDKKPGSHSCYIQPGSTETNPANLYLGSRSYKLVPEKVIVDNTQKNNTMVIGCKPTHRKSFNFFFAHQIHRDQWSEVENN